MTTTTRLSPLRFVLAFGVVSGLAEVVYEGARAIVGQVISPSRPGLRYRSVPLARSVVEAISGYRAATSAGSGIFTDRTTPDHRLDKSRWP